jgi:hypothetical protein
MTQAPNSAPTRFSLRSVPVFLTIQQIAIEHGQGSQAPDGHFDDEWAVPTPAEPGIVLLGRTPDGSNEMRENAKRARHVPSFIVRPAGQDLSRLIESQAGQ